MLQGEVSVQQSKLFSTNMANIEDAVTLGDTECDETYNQSKL